MKDVFSNKSFLVQAGVVLVFSGLLAWGMIALFQTPAYQNPEAYAGESFDEDYALEESAQDLDYEAENTGAVPAPAQP